MTPKQILQVVWARKWLVLVLLVAVSAAGIVTTMLLPRQYTAEATMVVEMRIDPVLGALAPSLAAPGYMATQIEIIRSDRVASRAVQMLGIERSDTAVKQWQKATEGKVPLEESVAIYERGEALKRRCEELLRQAEARVEKITLDAAGKPTGTGPLDVS